MVCAPFLSAVPRETKKTFVPQGPMLLVPLGQKSENFCGATQIGEKLARSAMCHHTSFPVTGEKSVGTYWPFGV
jgi:hypothetical protein